ncbi:MAG: FAD/NAD(P)-binding protein [Betaproteobacteria bacterium]|nr:FAD/NAD(P)-binding protein [Betaproteobacteria bacterium]
MRGRNPLNGRDLHCPEGARIVGRIDESDGIFTLRLRPLASSAAPRFGPGQFNMVYLFGVGEIPISIVSDPESDVLLDHTIRRVGRVSEGLARLQPGDCVGLRGPYGRGWPMERARGRDVIIVTGGLGCAPTVSVINYIINRRGEFGRLSIVQGVKRAQELIYRDRYEAWRGVPDTRVLLAADEGNGSWPWHVGLVTDLFDELAYEPSRTLAMLCGPEGMMVAAVRRLLRAGLPEEAIFLSMERNMQCALGLCGHCQYGAKFVCTDGPVFAYPELKAWFGTRGY